MLFQMVSHMTKFNASCRKKLTFKLSKKKKTNLHIQIRGVRCVLYAPVGHLPTALIQIEKGRTAMSNG